MSIARGLNNVCDKILKQQQFDKELSDLIHFLRSNLSIISKRINSGEKIVEAIKEILSIESNYLMNLPNSNQNSIAQDDSAKKDEKDAITNLHAAARKLQSLILQSSIQNQHVVAASSQPSSTYSPRQQKTKPVSGWGIFGGILGGLLIGGAVAAVSIFTGGLGWFALGGLGLLVGSICGGMTGARHGFWAGLGTGIGTGIIAPIVAIVVAITVIACCNGGGGGGGCVFVGGCGSCGDSSDNRDNRLSQDSGRKNSHSEICKKLDVDPSTTAPVTPNAPVVTDSQHDVSPPKYTVQESNNAAPTYGPLI